MTEREWRLRAARLRLELKSAQREVYHGQPEAGKKTAYESLRHAEDVLRLHMDNKTALVS